MTISELIAKYHRRPALYILRGDERSADWQGIQKIGTSASIPFRKNNWKTCSRYPVHFQHIFFLDPVTLPESGLYSIDSVILPEWLKLRDEWTWLHVYDGGGEEFYRFADPVAAMREFLSEQGIAILEELETDLFPFPFPFPFPCSSDGKDKDALEQELQNEENARKTARTMHNHLRLTQAICKKQFLRQFGIQALRRNQEELWDAWATLLATTSTYKGIVQWPTGTGKTFAMLILILLLYIHMREKGQIYRGILVAPQNSILDTLMKHIKHLRFWGLEVLDGTNAQFNGLTIPKHRPFIVVVTHASLTTVEKWNRFPSLNHIHYDEVHRITGNEFYDEMIKKLEQWNIPFITGTSATPKTSDPKQHEKLVRLFGTGDPLHCVTLQEAVEAGWIARPHFKVTTVEGEGAAIPGFLHEIKTLFTAQKFRNAKAIVYFDEIAQVIRALKYAREIWPVEWRLFKAIESGEEDVGSIGTDKEFVASEPTGIPQFLFACQKYREGSDVRGIDVVAYLMGRTTSAHIIEQIIGRAMRMDYEDKVATCLLVRPRFIEDEEDAVLGSVKLTLDCMYPDKKSIYERKSSKERPWSIEFKTDGAWLTAEESLLRVQNWYLRKSNHESLLEIKELCRSYNIRTSEEYHGLRKTLTGLPESPLSLCGNSVGWYEFLNGTEQTISLSEFQALMKSRNIRSHEEWSMVFKEYPAMPSPQQLMDGYFGGKEFASAPSIRR